jgi:hypothetical protein
MADQGNGYMFLTGTYQCRVNNRRQIDHISNSRKVLDFLVSLAAVPFRNEELESRNFHKISRPVRK